MFEYFQVMAARLKCIENLQWNKTSQSKYIFSKYLASSVGALTAVPFAYIGVFSKISFFENFQRHLTRSLKYKFLLICPFIGKAFSSAPLTFTLHFLCIMYHLIAASSTVTCYSDLLYVLIVVVSGIVCFMFHST